MTASETKGDEFYYAMIFGSQSKPKLLQYTHTWATFIRAVGEGPDANNYSVYQHTISWLPQSLDVRTWSLLPEPGVNLDLYRTLEAVYRDREHVTMWGPFRIHQVVYERSLGVKQILDSGVAEYRAISTPRNLLISDCIHAVAAVDPVFGRGHYPLIRIGKPASRYIARAGDDPERLRPMAGRQFLADPAPGPGPLSDRVRPTAADPQTELLPLPLPGLRPNSISPLLATQLNPWKPPEASDEANHGPAYPLRILSVG